MPAPKRDDRPAAQSRSEDEPRDHSSQSDDPFTGVWIDADSE